MGQYFDEREVRPAERRELDLLASLPGIVAHAKSAPYFATLLAHVDAESIRSRGALAQLPVTRKSDLKEHQSRQLPFGGMNATPVHNLAHLYMSPGPIFDLDGRSPDWWRFARPFHAAGLRAGDIIQNCFAYHFTPAAFMVDMAAQKLGCPVIPAGTGNTEMQVQAMRALSPSAYVGTPSFLKIIVEKAREAGARAIPFQRAVVSGEALPASLREWFRDQGIGVVTQIYASADLGNIAYETQTDGVVHAGLVIDEDICVEIVRPGTGDPVEPGEVGEVVVTTLNPD
jgi:phenylacetate-CoA ligase